MNAPPAEQYLEGILEIVHVRPKKHRLAARAEVTAPITAGVMTSFDLPPDQRPLVETQVDRLLATPTGAQTFVDNVAANPFNVAWGTPIGLVSGVDLVNTSTATGEDETVMEG